MVHRLRDNLDAGRASIGAQIRFDSPGIAELFGLAGFDYVVIDHEHAPQTPVGIQHQIQAMASSSATAVLRVPKVDPDLIRLYLDMGAGGVMVPLVSTPQEAELGAKACRYPPRGTRGYGPARASRYGFDPDYFAKANDQVVYIVIIETAEAVAQIDRILAVDGIDAYLVGPFDLSISLGIPQQFDHPRFTEAVETVFAAASSAGVHAGIDVNAFQCTPEVFKTPIAQGYKMLLVDGDEWMIKAACEKVMSCFRQAGG